MSLPNLDYKKILLLAGFVIVSLLLAFGVFWVFFLQGREEQPGQPGITTGPGGQLPGTGPGGTTGSGGFPVIGTGTPDASEARPATDSAQGGLTNVLPVNAEKALDPTSSRQGRDISFYDPASGQFYRVSSDGQNKTLMTDEKFYSVQSVSWSDDKNKAVLEFPDGANIIYDFTKRQSTTLPKEGVDYQFSSASDALAFKLETDNPDDNWLVITDSSGSNPKFIEPVGDRGGLVQVAFSPTEEVVALYHKPVGPSQEEIILLGQAGENYKSFVVDGLDFKGKFSPDGSRLLYSVISADNSYNPALWIVDAHGLNIGINKFNLGISTWVDKCVFSNDNRVVYCAVPRSLPSGVGLAAGAQNTTSDIFYRVDLDTGLKQLLAEPADQSRVLDASVTDIWLDDNEIYLFFWDTNTGQVYRMRLE